MRALVPEDLTTGRAIAERATKSLARALLASARALALPDRDPMQVAQAEWSHDDATRTILRAAVAPASTANAANAVLLETAVAGVVLGGVGAGADLLRRGLVLSFGRSASIKLPALIADATHGAFVAEDGVIPAYQESTASPPTLVPHKLCRHLDDDKRNAHRLERRGADHRSRPAQHRAGAGLRAVRCRIRGGVGGQRRHTGAQPGGPRGVLPSRRCSPTSTRC
jgi:hypothetical protein